ncbi:MAG: ArsA family ATPase [Myxococcales bacterium]|nr:ArsA family ATPase [Myxococcales bacterium]
MSPGLVAPIQQHKVLVTVGAGGVGKTSTAAAVGLLGARLGRRTLVMTIDPARRLAASLGLADLDHQQRAVPADKMAAAGLRPELLYAMMLDQKATFDELIRRQARDEEDVRRVMANKLYHELSTRLAGGQEYAAMEKLHELTEAGSYELVVLDTPPTANALDFLDAPRKMVDMVDSPAVSMFLRTYRAAGRFSFKLLSAGASLIFRRLSRFLGGEFLDDIAQFFADMQGLLEGFRDRANKVIELLSRDDVGFVIVTSPDPRAIDEAIALFDRLEKSRMSTVGIVVNRVHALRPVAIDEPGLAAALQALGASAEHAAALAPRALASHRDMQLLAEVDAQEIARLKAHCGLQLGYTEVPLFDEDIYDMAGLTKLGQYLA